jgi:hypothetical protein
MIFANNNRKLLKVNTPKKKGSDHKMDKWRQYDEKDRYSGFIDPPADSELGMPENEYPPGDEEESSEEYSEDDQSGQNLSVVPEERENSTIMGDPNRQHDLNFYSAEDDSAEEGDFQTESSSDHYWRDQISGVFKKAKKGLLSYKKNVKGNIEDAINNKKVIEAELDNIATKPERWRILRRRIKFLAMMRKGAQHRKIYGEHPWKTIVSDESGMIDAMRNEVFIWEKEKRRKKCLLYDDHKVRQIWNFILIWLFVYTAFITP